MKQVQYDKPTRQPPHRYTIGSSGLYVRMSTQYRTSHNGQQQTSIHSSTAASIHVLRLTLYLARVVFFVSFLFHAMRTVLVLLALAVLAVSANAGVLYQRTTVPKGWVMLGIAPKHSHVNFTIGLKTQNDAELEALFWAVSDPDSEQYLQYPSAAMLEERFGASAEDRAAVTTWLQQSGVHVKLIQHVSSAIRVRTLAETASKLFNTEIRQFKHNSTGAVTYKAWGAYSLPDAIHQRVELVTGISSFPAPGRNVHKTPGGPSAAVTEAVIPQTVANLYSIRTQSPGSSAATQGVVEYQVRQPNT